jgi:hypothetical protein
MIHRNSLLPSGSRTLPFEARRGEGTVLMGYVSLLPKRQSSSSRLRRSRAASNSGASSSAAHQPTTRCTRRHSHRRRPCGSRHHCQFGHRRRVLRRQHWRTPAPVGLGGGASSPRSPTGGASSPPSLTRAGDGRRQCFFAISVQACVSASYNGTFVTAMHAG